MFDINQHWFSICMLCLCYTAEDAIALMLKGMHNRHVGETKMNRESSRSHSVFTCTVEKSSKATNGVTSVMCSRLNLIDLAGERGCRAFDEH